ncbi:MAG: ribonuclease M5 [Anaerovoracaceae bacterium]
MSETRIEEIIVVEGRDDTAAVRRAVDADTIETHGFGIAAETWELIAKAYETRGIIVFTDPDHAGEQIRKRVTERFPHAKQAFLAREKATAGDDIGIENAQTQDIIRALEAAKARVERRAPAYTMDDMWQAGLTGIPGSSAKRRRLGEMLGIGYGNSVTFLRRLNSFGIDRGKFDEAIHSEEYKGTEE